MAQAAAARTTIGAGAAGVEGGYRPADLAGSAAVVAGSCGLRPVRPVMTVIGVLEGAAVSWGIAAAAAAAAPAAALIWPWWAMWLAYWRLRPLWSALARAVPHVGLPAERGAGSGIRWRLLRRGGRDPRR